MSDAHRDRQLGRYQAYLVRLWQEHPHASWRALAKDARTGQEFRFATLEQLFLFLHERTAGDRAPEER